MSQETFNFPEYSRESGEIGIYIDIYDAESYAPIATKAYFLTQITERFYELAKCQDLLEIKAKFNRLGYLQNSVFERIEKGVMLVVNTQCSVTDLEEVVRLADSGELSAILGTIFATRDRLDHLGARRVDMRCRVSPADVKRVKLECAQGEQRVSTTDQDRRLLSEIVAFQNNELGANLDQVRDSETNVEKMLGSIIMSLKITAGKDHPIRFIGEVRGILDKHKTKTNFDRQALIYFLSIVDLINSIVHDLQDKVFDRLTAAHIVKEMRSEREEILQLLSTLKSLASETEALSHMYNPWSSKVLPREKDNYLPLLSVIPLSKDILLDLALQLESYTEMSLKHFS